MSPYGSRFTSFEASSTLRLTTAPSLSVTRYLSGLSKGMISTTGPR